MTAVASHELAAPPSDERPGDDTRPAAAKTPTWRRVLRRPLAAVSLAYLVLLVLAAVFADVVAPHDPADLDLDHVLSGPSAGHLLGTDPLGRDVLSRLIHGGQVSLVNGGVAALTFVLAGVAAGLVAGFFGGWTDRVFTWVVDVVIAIPGLIVLLVVLTVFGGNMTVAMVALGILSAPGFARVVRGVTLGVRQELYISAAKVSGLPNRHILLRHVLPRVTGPILVQASLFFGAALLVDAGLAYLGFGVQPPTPTWGGMIIEAASVISQQPWLLVPPGITLALATLSFALLGDAIRDASAERTGRQTTKTRRRPPALRAEPTRPAGAPDPAALLSVRGLTVALPASRGPVDVVADVDLDVRAGETVGLVGESGCGKSITASALFGLLPAGGEIRSGRVQLSDIDLATAGGSALRAVRGSRIAMISQEPVASLDPVFTAGQQVDELVRRHHGGSRKTVRARSLDLFASVRLRDPESVARRYPHELSGGMAQRVAIAMALAGEPDLLVADEPTTALDVTVQAEILRLIQSIQAERGMAVLLITHDWGVVAQVCQRAYVMYAGHVVESAPVAAMIDQPLHPYSAGLLGSMPGRGRPGHHLASIPGTVPAPADWPDGCHFAPRCALASSDCNAPVPLSTSAPGRLSRCVHHTQLIERVDE